jgi:hypothetical protein
MMVDADAPVDDAFIRTAIRGLRAPDHHPAFWSELAGELDAAQRVLVAQGHLVAPPEQPLVVQLPEARPERAPARPRTEQPRRRTEQPRRQVHVAAPTAAAPADTAPHPPRREPLRAGAPAHAAPAAAERIRAFGPGAPAAPRPKLVVDHDPAVVPQSLRRSSNAVLLAIAAAAATIALVAGLTLVRQRSDDGGAPPAEQPADTGAAALEEPATGSG